MMCVNSEWSKEFILVDDVCFFYSFMCLKTIFSSRKNVSIINFEEDSGSWYFS